MKQDAAVLPGHPPSDLFRIGKSKEAVGVSPPTIRKYALEGLPVYKRGKGTRAPVFVSRRDFEAFIRGELRPKEAA